MHTVWAQRREEVVNDCCVSPDVFHRMVERLTEFVMPYQHVLERVFPARFGERRAISEGYLNSGFPIVSA